MKLKKFFSSNIREISLIIVMIALSVFIEIRSGGNFFTLENISDMFTETAVLAITAVGMMMVIITRGIDLSIGSIMALGAMVGGTILKNNQAVPGVVIILVSIAVGIVCGFINGTLVAKLKILPIIATLGMMNIYRGLTYLVANGSWVKQQEMGTKFLSIATGKFLGINNLIVVAIVVYIIAAFFLNKTRTGRKIYAVGNSEESARVSGIKTDRTLIMVYTIFGASLHTPPKIGTQKREKKFGISNTYLPSQLGISVIDESAQIARQTFISTAHLSRKSFGTLEDITMLISSSHGKT